MTNVRQYIESYRIKNPVDWYLLEQDYALSWMLYGITQVPLLANHLVFKGGTCLKKCYFGDYRFSQDLDFSVRGFCPVKDRLESLIISACSIATQNLQSKKSNITFTSKRYAEKQAHPENQEAFSIFVRYPWQQEAMTRIMIEITHAETVYLPVQERPIIHGYNDDINATISTYALEEIIAEKIAALLSFSQKLHERGWGRSRARDYYDLWRIFSCYKNQLDRNIIPEIASKKCTRKNLVFKNTEDLFNDTLMQDLDVAWEQWVKPLVVDLPAKETVLKELRQMLNSFL